MTDIEIIGHLKSKRYSKAVKGLSAIYPSVKEYILANNGTKEDAEDIFQDAFVVLYKNINTPAFALTSSLKTYLQSVSKNLWYNVLRQKNKYPLVNDSTEIPNTAEKTAEADYKLAEMAFELLGKKCRQLLIAFYYKKESLSQIARSLSFSSEQVARNQKYRCLRKAKENYAHLKNGSS